jgi:hypothetical protein
VVVPACNEAVGLATFRRAAAPGEPFNKTRQRALCLVQRHVASAVRVGR